MINFIFNVILWTFALYGIFEIIKTVIHTYYKPKITSNGIYFFIAVKNQESTIEGFLRTTFFRLIYGKEDFIKNVIIVDLNSSDKTLEILNMISKDYDCVYCTDLKNCKEILDSISTS